MLAERLQRRSGGFLWRIEETDETGKNEIRLVRDRVWAVVSREFAIRHRDDTEAILIHLGDELLGILPALVAQLDDPLLLSRQWLVAHVPAHGENLLDGTLADELMVAVLVVDDDGHAPPGEVERAFVDLAVRFIDC